MPKKYIGMSFFNELTLLQIKLEQYYDYYDGIVICEGSRTQSGLQKPFYFEESKSDFSKYLDKIIHLKISDNDWPKMSNAWDFDIFQRNYVAKAFDIVNLQNEDIFGIEDADEITSKQELKHLDSMDEILVYSAPYFVYWLNLVVTGRKWNTSVHVRGETAKVNSLQKIIKYRDHVSHESNPDIVKFSYQNGHFGYQFGKELILKKYKSAVEPFDKVNGIPVEEHFDKVFDEAARPNGHFIFCDNLSNHSLPLSLSVETPNMIKKPELDKWFWKE